MSRTERILVAVQGFRVDGLDDACLACGSAGEAAATVRINFRSALARVVVGVLFLGVVGLIAGIVQVGLAGDEPAAPRGAAATGPMAITTLLLTLLLYRAVAVRRWMIFRRSSAGRVLGTLFVGFSWLLFAFSVLGLLLVLAFTSSPKNPPRGPNWGHGVAVVVVWAEMAFILLVFALPLYGAIAARRRWILRGTRVRTRHRHIVRGARLAVFRIRGTIRRCTVRPAYRLVGRGVCDLRLDGGHC